MRVHLRNLELDIEQGEALTFRQIAEDGSGIEGKVNWEDMPPALVAALVDLEQITQVKGNQILELIPAEEWAYAAPYTKGAETPPHYCEGGEEA